MFGTASLRRTATATLGVLALVLATVTPASASETYVVSPGDTLSGIALRYGISVDTLVRLNGIQNPNVIYAGQQISVSSSTGQPSGQPASPSSTYTVQPGDTLW